MLVPFAKPVLSKIHRFKDIHRGESCYLIGDGVSVKWFDLAAFSDKTALPCGYIPFHNDFSRLDVKYLSLAEPFWFYPLNWTTSPPIKLIPNKLQMEYRNVIKNNPNKEFFEAPTAGNGATCKSCSQCPWMGLNSLQNLEEVLKKLDNEIIVDPEVAMQAKISLSKMINFQS